MNKCKTQYYNINKYLTGKEISKFFYNHDHEMPEKYCESLSGQNKLSINKSYIGTLKQLLLLIKLESYPFPISMAIKLALTCYRYNSINSKQQF